MKRFGNIAIGRHLRLLSGAKTNDTFVIKVALGETLFAHYSNILITEKNLAINAIINMGGTIDWNVEI